MIPQDLILDHAHLGALKERPKPVGCSGTLVKDTPILGAKMGHWCWMCGRTRPNEKFPRKGHRKHLCRDCARRPEAEREAVQQARDIAGFLEQSRISQKNIERLETLRDSDNPEIAEMATVVLEVGRARPGKRKRLQHLARERRDLLEDLQRLGLIVPRDDDDDIAEYEIPDEWEPGDMGYPGGRSPIDW